PPPPGSTLFPYTTLFRSLQHVQRTLPRLGAIEQRQQGAARPRVLRVPVDRVAERGQRAVGVLERRQADLAQRREEVGLLARLGRSEEHTSELQSRGHLVC